MNEQFYRGLIEGSPYPVYLVNGPDLIIRIANKATLKAWGRDDGVIGMKFPDALPELKNQPFERLIREVMATGKPYFATNDRADIVIDGEFRTFYFNFSYQPLVSEDGAVHSVMCFATDVTAVEVALRAEQTALKKTAELNDELQAVVEELKQSQQNLFQLNKELQESNEHVRKVIVQLQDTQENLALQNVQLAMNESRLRYLLSDAPVAVAVLNTADMIIESANKKMLEAWGKTSEIIGLPLRDALPELIGQQFLQLLDDVYTSGEPYNGYEVKALIEQGGVMEEVYSNFVYQPLKNLEGKTNGVMLTANVVTEQVKSRKNIEQAETRLRLAIEAAHLGAWFIEPGTMELAYNPTLAMIFGYEGTAPMTYDQAIAQVTDEYRQVIVDEISRALATGGDYDIIYSQRRFNDNQLIWLRSIGKVLPAGDGSVGSFSGFVLDVTEQKKDDQRKNDFIAMVSHELKTPLTLLHGYIQMLQGRADSAGDAFTYSSLNTASKQVKKMTGMINGFLNVSQFESGKIVLEKTSFMLDELIRHNVSDLQQLYTSHRFNIDDLEPVKVNADHDKLSNVLSNLLSNAIKYAPGKTEIMITCKKDGPLVRVTVTDQGIGISAEDIGKLFKRYSRVDGNRNASGFGLGLYLSSEIIERHGGSIRVESEPGSGSSFIFTLPVE